ncbi:hypothetical protein BGZ76_002888 [Entomortierella beljakovae]|nr:hypothetical protein BGZ76_002888 [Entomortierella beljakovae]
MNTNTVHNTSEPPHHYQPTKGEVFRSRIIDMATVRRLQAVWGLLGLFGFMSWLAIMPAYAFRNKFEPVAFVNPVYTFFLVATVSTSVVALWQSLCPYLIRHGQGTIWPKIINHSITQTIVIILSCILTILNFFSWIILAANKDGAKTNCHEGFLADKSGYVAQCRGVNVAIALDAILFLLWIPIAVIIVCGIIDRGLWWGGKQVDWEHSKERNMATRDEYDLKDGRYGSHNQSLDSLSQAQGQTQRLAYVTPIASQFQADDEESSQENNQLSASKYHQNRLQQQQKQQQQQQQHQEQETLVITAPSGPRNPQYVPPVSKNPQTYNDDVPVSAISAATTIESTHSSHRMSSTYSNSTHEVTKPLTHAQSFSVASTTTAASRPMAPTHAQSCSSLGNLPAGPQSYNHQSYVSSTTYTPKPSNPAQGKGTTSQNTQHQGQGQDSHPNNLLNSFGSMNINSGGPASNQTNPTRIFVDSKDDVPRLFLIAPTFEEPLVKGPYKPIRIILPCQAPSAYYGDEEAIHMTSHNGYTIKNPNDFLHNNRDAIRMGGTIVNYFAAAANLAASLQGMASAGDIAASAMGSVVNTAGNRTHMNAAGLDTGSMYEKHLATENHQREALKILLKAASASDPTQSMTGELNGVVLNNGRTIWVCKECYDLMLKGEQIKRDFHVSLRDYDSLTKRVSPVNVLIRCSASLIIFTNALKSHPYPQKVTIRIAPEYFEAPERSHRAAVASFQSLFNDLGVVLYKHRLSSLEIQGKSETGFVYVNLSNVLKCSSLEQLAITGLPLFLQGADIPKECKLLTMLVLDGVRVDTEQSAVNLRNLIFNNPSLTNLRISRAGFTKNALDTLFYDSSKSKDRLFKKLIRLNLSENNMEVVTATTFVSMAFKSNDLSHLDISGNPRIADSGCRAILTLLREKPHKLTELNTDRTGIDWRTRIEINDLLCVQVKQI